ncbi:hypothetical protein ACGC1H_005098 [Rhizoctonia solani]
MLTSSDLCSSRSSTTAVFGVNPHMTYSPIALFVQVWIIPLLSKSTQHFALGPLSGLNRHLFIAQTRLHSIMGHLHMKQTATEREVEEERAYRKAQKAVRRARRLHSDYDDSSSSKHKRK